MTFEVFGVRVTRGLSTTESGAVACALDGMTAKESARAMGCGFNTVEQALQKLCADFGAANRAHLVAALAVAADRGELPPAKGIPTAYNPRRAKAFRGAKVCSVWRLAA